MPDGTKLVLPDRLAELTAMALDGANEGALFELSCVEMLSILQHIETLGDAIVAEAGDYCGACGCTQNNACEGGCHWVAEGLCSACQYDVQPCDDGEVGWVVVDRISGETLGDEHGQVVYRDSADALRAAQRGTVAMNPGDEDPLDWGEVPDAG